MTSPQGRTNQVRTAGLPAGGPWYSMPEHSHSGLFATYWLGEFRGVPLRLASVWWLESRASAPETARGNENDIVDLCRPNGRVAAA